MYCLTVLEAICPGSRCPWGWFLLRVEREECVSLLSSGGWPAILGILWLVEASLHLCLHLHVFSLDVYLYPNFPFFIETVVYWIHFSSVQLLSRVRLFATPWTAAGQASLSNTNSLG
ncbi:unnamed protein product [Rangifer tarandus platyrhynchus]|uniref:Uncharacterized protein n=1 Tax=Rangifer tarandus platyrhynchus TaxID=3082113 RepID=A0ABN8ZCM1_RANTA|nr:unnamed protein product [Rangifer tarandus platyrhynchus]